MLPFNRNNQWGEQLEEVLIKVYSTRGKQGENHLPHYHLLHWRNAQSSSRDPVTASPSWSLGRVFLFPLHSLSLLCCFTFLLNQLFRVNVCCQLWAPLWNLCICKPVSTSFVQHKLPTHSLLSSSALACAGFPSPSCFLCHPADLIN